MQRIWVHAVSVHVGGGRALLEALLRAAPLGLRVSANLDERLPLPRSLPGNIEVHRVAPTIRARLLAEMRLASEVKSSDQVLCFGNLPPLRRLRGRVVLFLQNRYLIDPVNLAGFPLKVQFRIMVERWWLRSRRGNVDCVVVQTPSMKELADGLFRMLETPVSIMPFSSLDGLTDAADVKPMASKEVTEFLYVASGEPHKNHRRLIEAWIRLARDGYFPSLALTLDRSSYQPLCDWIEEKKREFGLKILNLGMQSRSEILELYSSSRALIYPSTFESFGLPLIEAKAAGMAVLAAELDYVRDVLDPDEVFDPRSAVSISRAVKRFNGWQEEQLPLIDARQFIRSILDGREVSCES